MKLDKLIENIDIISIAENSEEKEITGISNNSREVQNGYIFVAVKGYKTDGHKYISDAISNGALAVVLEDENNIPDELFGINNVAKIIVKESRKAFADLSCRFYDDPSKKLTLIGITGSNGKTTTAFYVKNLLEFAGFKTGLLGTISNIVGDVKVDSSLTTPESNVINKLMKQMVEQGITHCVMEVSSHALELDRVRGLDFDYAVFTNISSDHMDFHNSIENYISAKSILFKRLKKNAKVIYNIDDLNAGKIIEDSVAEKLSFGQSNRADYRIENIDYNLEGTSFTLDGKYNFTTKLIGEFNAYNAASAAIIGELEGVDREKIVNGINSTPHVPGRFEVVGRGKKKVIIDYSHTADSLQKALDAITKIVNGRNSIHTVFGCGGDRDKTKRPVMGKIADIMSNKIYVTSDNPRTENPTTIINEILEGVERDNPIVIEDREEAIKKAICSSEENAVILIAGKGHEEYQLINGVKYHFSDREIAEKYLGVCG